MPRNRRTSTKDVVIPSNSMVASAIRYPGKAPAIYRGTAEWQRECYRHFEICGEARYAATYFGHALSRMVLYAAKKTPEGYERQTSGKAYELLEELFSGKAGQAQMLSAIGTHLTIAGECYLVGRSVIGPDETDADLWEIVSVLEMKVAGDKWAIHYGERMKDVELDIEKDVVIRIWTPHPAKRIEADSPFRSLLPILSEIEWLTKHIFKQVSSHLTGAGVLFLSQGMEFPAPPEVDGKPVAVQNEAESFTLTLGENMLDPIHDPSSPAAAIPLVVTVPEEVMKSGNIAEHLQFWSPLDENSKDLRDEAIRRFALGMDLDPEVVLGMSSNNGTGGGSSNGISHWGAWQIEESTIKMHVEPMAETVVNALVIGFIRPLTQDATDVIRYDSSALKLRPDRSREALELNARGLLKDSVVLVENGFDAKDAMTPEEQKRWMLMRVAGGSATPEQVQAALKALGVELDVVEGNVPDGSPPSTRETRPPPSLEDHPTRPRTPEKPNPVPEAAALLAASDALVYRALERAGNRIRQSAGIKPPGVPTYIMHTLHSVNGDADRYLDDAWSCAPQVLDGLADVDTTVQTLNAYVKALFAEQAPHTRARLSKWLEGVGSS